MAKHEQINTPEGTPVTHGLGVFPGIPNAEYHGGPGISKSGLDIIHRSPMHYKAAREAGPRESTPAQRRGTLVHDLVLEPDTFWDRYAEPFVAPEGAISTVDEIKERLKAIGAEAPSKAKRDELKAILAAADPTVVFLDDAKAAHAASVGDKVIVSAEELARAQAMADAVMSHSVAGKLLSPKAGVAELSCYWLDEETGVLCRCRPDFWRDDGIIVDLKTTADASLEAFQRSIHDWRYHVQQAFYEDGIAAAKKQAAAQVDDATGLAMNDGWERPMPKAFLFVAVENDAPHAVAIYRVETDSVEIGRREYRADLAAYAESLRTDKWPGYSDRIEPIGLPAWRLRQEEINGEDV
jgi:hypothetical protein